MGNWGTGPFDNDDVAGLLEELVEVSADEAAAFLRAAMATALAPGFVDAPEMSEAIAAAGVVAVTCGASSSDPDLNEWLLETGFAADPDLIVQAAQLLSRAIDPTDNELYDLWHAAGRLDAVRASHAPFQQALTDARHRASHPT